MASKTTENFTQAELDAAAALLDRQIEIERVYPQTHRLFWPLIRNAARRLAPPTRTAEELLSDVFLT